MYPYLLLFHCHFLKFLLCPFSLYISLSTYTMFPRINSLKFDLLPSLGHPSIEIILIEIRSCYINHHRSSLSILHLIYHNSRCSSTRTRVRTGSHDIQVPTKIFAIATWCKNKTHIDPVKSWNLSLDQNVSKNLRNKSLVGSGQL